MISLKIGKGTFSYSRIPLNSGVYLFLDRQKKPLYIGKAKNLRRRLRAYFKKTPVTAKVSLLRQKSQEIKIIPTSSELEAFLLEAHLIKKYQPRYNTQLKDDKHYLYIKITQEKIPLITTARKKRENQRSLFFGPYPSSQIVRSFLRTLRKTFPYRSCLRLPHRPCLYSDLHLCPAPCLGTTQKIKENQESIRKITAFLRGESPKIIAAYQEKMRQASQKEEFEKASSYQRIINQLKEVTQKRIDPIFFEDQLLQRLNPWEKLQAAHIFLGKYLSLPPLAPGWRIEGYDVAHISGQEATGSLVVFVNGSPQKSQYRQFRLHYKKIDDPIMIAEILKRRFSHPEWPLPQLILIDGGKPQLSAAYDILKENNISLPVVALAKKEETLIIKKGRGFQEIRTNPQMVAALILRAIRDEAHRFAQRYHHLLRQKKLVDKK